MPLPSTPPPPSDLFLVRVGLAPTCLRRKWQTDAGSQQVGASSWLLLLLGTHMYVLLTCKLVDQGSSRALAFLAFLAYISHACKLTLRILGNIANV